MPTPNPAEVIATTPTNVMAPGTTGPIQLLSFPAAVEQVTLGRRVSKAEWKDPAIWLEVKDGRLQLHKAEGTWHPVLISEGDLMGGDWFVLP